MLDTKIWSSFVDSNFADFAIGGPTLEMLYTACNQRYDTKYQLKVPL